MKAGAKTLPGHRDAIASGDYVTEPAVEIEIMRLRFETGSRRASPEAGSR